MGDSHHLTHSVPLLYLRRSIESLLPLEAISTPDYSLIASCYS